MKKIESIEPVTISYHRVVFDDGNEYERYSSDNWRWIIGESTETVYNAGILEDAFQASNDSNVDQPGVQK